MDNINKTIYEIASKTDSYKITVFTNEFKIDGTIYQCDGKCKEITDGILTLNDAIVCRLEDYCNCNDDECECNDFVCFKYNWLNIMHSNIVAYSLL